MIKYLAKVQKLLTQLLSYRIRQIPRSANAQVDRLAKLATSRTNDLDTPMYIKILEAPSIEEFLFTLCAISEPSWMDPIVRYLRMGALSTDASVAHKIKRMASHSTLVGE